MATTGKIADGIKLTVALGALAKEQDLKALGDVLSAARKIVKDMPKGLKALADDLTKDAEATFAAMSHELPDDAARLYVQMVEASIPSAAEIVAVNLRAKDLIVCMQAKLTYSEYKSEPMPRLFEDLTKPVLERVLASKEATDELTPEIFAQLLELGRDANEVAHENNAILLHLASKFGGLEAALTNPEALEPRELKAIADRFGEVSVEDRESLVKFLTLKSVEYHSYKAEIDAIDERTKGLGNLKAAAKEAAERLDFEEVEDLLSHIHETEIEIAAETAELRADNALLRGKVDQAYDLLGTAATGFRTVDALEPVRRRILYAKRLYEHGLRYSSRGLARTVDLLQSAIQGVSRTNNPELWASSQNNLAIALRNQGTRTGGADGTRLIAKAVASYRSALTVYSREIMPVQWAMTQNNLGAALGEQGTRTDGEEGIRLLAEAVAAFRDALTVRSREAMPNEWAMTQNNLGNALGDQSARTGGQDGTSLLAEAVSAFRDSLTVFTREEMPVQWATIQNNLGVALYDQGTRTGGADGTRLLAEAVTAYQNALTVRTRKSMPLQWAMTQQNIGLATRDMATVESERRVEHLGAALEAFDLALEVYDPEHMPRYHQACIIARTKAAAQLAAL